MKKTKTDALIIGSGVGGLCTAARLVEKGMKVCVVERLSRLGGRFSTRDIKGCKITTGAIMVPYGKTSIFHEAFELLKAPFNVRLSKGGFCYRTSDGDLEIPPEGGGGLLSMFKFALKDDKKVMELLQHFKRASTWFPPSYKISFREWLSQYTDNAQVQNMMQGFCGAFVGTSSQEVPAGEFFIFLKEMGRGNRYGIAVNGNIELMDSLAQSIEKRGSQILKGAACKKILVDNYRVKGAVIEQNGTQEIIEADYVISNTGPERTVKLAGQENFENSYISLLKENPYETPVFHISIISKEPLHEFQGIFNFGNTKKLVFMECPTLTCPELAPEGHHITTTFSIAESSEGPVSHEIRKQTISEALQEIKENFPTFESNRESMIICAHHGEWPSMRRWPGYPMPVKTPVENLYNVGDGCMPPGTVGVEAAAVSAKIVSKSICKER